MNGKVNRTDPDQMLSMCFLYNLVCSLNEVKWKSNIEFNLAHR